MNIKIKDMIIKIFIIIIILIKLWGIFNGIYDIEFLRILSEVLEEHIINLSTGDMDDMGGNESDDLSAHGGGWWTNIS